MIDVKDVCCVVLASGYSRRFGGNKLVAPLPSGVSVLEQTLSVYKLVFDSVWLVHRNDDFDLSQIAEKIVGVRSVINGQASHGMSQSIVAAVRQTKPRQGWLFALADMPYVSALTIEAIVEQAAENAIVIPRIASESNAENASRLGNPVFIGRAFADQLLQIEGDVGAKSVVQSNQHHHVYVDCNDVGIVADIDRPEDIQ